MYIVYTNEQKVDLGNRGPLKLSCVGIFFYLMLYVTNPNGTLVVVYTLYLLADGI